MLLATLIRKVVKYYEENTLQSPGHHGNHIEEQLSPHCPHANLPTAELFYLILRVLIGEILKVLLNYITCKTIFICYPYLYMYAF